MAKKHIIQLMDTTLRDGEQTSGVSFTDSEKLTIAQLLLEELNVDRLEIASARVSEGEFKSVARIMKWAKQKKYLDRIEVLSFIDSNQSIDWIVKAGGKVANLLTKGSLRHVREQLRKEPKQHLADIKAAINYARKKGITCNLYLEDWSNGMRNSKDYVFFLMDGLKNEPIKRFMLPDTLGILNPDETYEFCSLMVKKYPKLDFDFHAHNDYDLATANVLAAVRAGITGVHTTVNGLGERAGNVPLSSVIAVLKDHTDVAMNVREDKITLVSKMVETFSGIRIPKNKPVVGENVFIQTCGVHADGDNKNKLYYNDLLPERFGRVRSYALGKTSGKANIEQNLKELGIHLDAESVKKVTRRVIELGDKKENVTKEDLPYIISDVLDSSMINEKIKIRNYSLTSVNGLKPVATISISINNEVYEETGNGDGQYDAFMKAIWKIYDKLRKKHPVLSDYMVTIPPGGKTDALVETVITWQFKGKEFHTAGLDSDQTVAAIKATMKMLNLIENQ
jgi:(R)-citramalate synthase